MILEPLSMSDQDPARTLFVCAFSQAEDEAEGRLIGELVGEIFNSTAAHDLYGFVARNRNELIGVILFTRLSYASERNVFMLSPVAVAPDSQRQGVGQQLIRYGLQQLKDAGVELVFTYGDPNYYSLVGYQPVSTDVLAAPMPLSQPHGWLCQNLDGQAISAIAEKPECVPAFQNPALW